MTINLKKGQRISLTKEAPGLTQVMCALGWDVAQKGVLGKFKSDYDLDASVLCLDPDGKLKSTADVIYYGNLSHRSGAITHLGDNLTGSGEGDDEQILVDLRKMPSEIGKLIFTVNIYNCIPRKQDFGQVKNAFVRLVDTANNREVVRYNLSGNEYQGTTGTILAEVYREGEEWKVGAVGEGLRINGLEDLVKTYS